MCLHERLCVSVTVKLEANTNKSNEGTTAGTADKIGLILGNVLTNAMKHKQTIVYKHF